MTRTNQLQDAHLLEYAIRSREQAYHRYLVAHDHHQESSAHTAELTRAELRIDVLIRRIIGWPINRVIPAPLSHPEHEDNSIFGEIDEWIASHVEECQMLRRRSPSKRSSEPADPSKKLKNEE